MTLTQSVRTTGTPAWGCTVGLMAQVTFTCSPAFVALSFWPAAAAGTGSVISTGLPGGAGTAVISRTVIVFALGSTAMTSTATGPGIAVAAGFEAAFFWTGAALAADP